MFEAWYEAYYQRISAWITDCSIGRPAHLILNLPPLVQALLYLSQQEALAPELRGRLGRKAEIIMEGMNYLPPTDIATVSLSQDSVSIAHFLSQLLAEVPPALQAAAWQGDGTLPDTLAWILEGKTPKGC